LKHLGALLFTGVNFAFREMMSMTATMKRWRRIGNMTPSIDEHLHEE